MDEVYAAPWAIGITFTFSPSDIGDQDNRDTDSNKKPDGGANLSI